MQPKKQKQHKKKYAVAVGGLFIVLALIGIATIVISSIRLTMNLLDNQKQKQQFADWLQPVVMFDPAPFSSPSEIDMQFLLQYGMWGVLSGEKAGDYPRNETSKSLIVPESDVEAAAYNLFGDAVTLKHATFSDNETIYLYNAEDHVYEVPTFGYLYVYRPEVYRIEKKDGLYHIMIKYIPPDNAWNSVFTGGVEFFSNKMMVYVVERTANNEWRLLTVQDPPQDVIDDLGLQLEGIPVNSEPDPLPSDETTSMIDTPTPKPEESSQEESPASKESSKEESSKEESDSSESSDSSDSKDGSSTEESSKETSKESSSKEESSKEQSSKEESSKDESSKK